MAEAVQNHGSCSQRDQRLLALSDELDRLHALLASDSRFEDWCKSKIESIHAEVISSVTASKGNSDGSEA